MEIGENLVVVPSHLRRGQAITSIRPDEYGGMRPQHVDLRPQTFPCNSMIFRIPLAPFFPLVTAHPAQHDGDSLLIGKIKNVLTGNLRLPAEEVQAMSLT